MLSSAFSQRVVYKLLCHTPFAGSSLSQSVRTRCLCSTLSSDCVASGDRVTLHTVISINGNTVENTIESNRPLEFVVGSSLMLAGMNEGVVGMSPGEKKSLSLPPELAFGALDPEKVFKFEISAVPEDARSVGKLVEFQKGEESHRGMVVNVDDDAVVINTNHMAAGQTLDMDIELISRLPASEFNDAVIPRNTVQDGDGITYPKVGDTLEVHYTGYIAENGQKFDCTRERGFPLRFMVGMGQVIKGWDEGLMHMSKGQRSELYIPTEKAYGSAGVPNLIPPNHSLVFDVELVSVDTENKPGGRNVVQVGQPRS